MGRVDGAGAAGMDRAQEDVAYTPHTQWGVACAHCDYAADYGGALLAITVAREHSRDTGHHAHAVNKELLSGVHNL